MKAIVVEDSRLAREGLMRMLQNFPDIDLVGAADHPVGIQHQPAALGDRGARPERGGGI